MVRFFAVLVRRFKGLKHRPQHGPRRVDITISNEDCHCWPASTASSRRRRSFCCQSRSHISKRSKVDSVVFQALTGQAPAYLADDCRLIIRIGLTQTPLFWHYMIRWQVFQLLVLKFGTVYHLRSGLRTWRLTVSNEDLRPICLHWCDEISAYSDYWFLSLYKFSLCMYVCMYSYYTRNVIKGVGTADSVDTFRPPPPPDAPLRKYSGFKCWEVSK